MSSSSTFHNTTPALLVVLLVVSCLAMDDDFAFDINEDLEVDFSPDAVKELWDQQKVAVGHLLYIQVPKSAQEDSNSFKGFESKTEDGKHLPSWLLFDKEGGRFWGVPLQDDVGDLSISVKAVDQSDNTTHHYRIRIQEDDLVDRCERTEDITKLTFVLNKDIKAIKPKQRIVAISSIAKFFAMPVNAFALLPEAIPDDITDNSVILAGPGDHKKSSRLGSILEVVIGCDGRLWMNSVPIVHQLKAQAKDGTISEVLRLPVVGWRVKVEKASVRAKRSPLESRRSNENSYGSGDEEYTEYYDEDEYDDPNAELDDVSYNKPKTTSTTTTSTTTTTTLPPRTTHASTTTSSTTTSSKHTQHEHEITTPAMTSKTHPHRHHHGELWPLESGAGLPFGREHNHSTTVFIPIATEKVPDVVHTTPTVPPTTSASSTPSTTSTTTELPTIQTAATTNANTTSPPLTGLHNPGETLDTDDEYDDYDDGDDDDESITEIPVEHNEVFTTGNQNIPKQEEVELEKETALVLELTTPNPHNYPIELIPAIVTTIKPTEQTFQNESREAAVTKDVLVTTPSTTTVTEPSTTTTTTTTTMTPNTSLASTKLPPTTTASTTTVTEQTSTLEPSSSTKLSTVRHVPTTTRTYVPVLTESIEYEMKNFPPSVQNRINRIATTTGKYFVYKVPGNTFTDVEDGSNLTLELLSANGDKLSKKSWCQFNPKTKEMYGLPLQEDVSRWEFLLKATDSEGASVTDRVEIVVQQHKHWRAVNHEFTLYARVEKYRDDVYPVDWAIRIMKGISNVYQNSNISEITVRGVNYTTDPLIFVWTNDSVSIKFCPKEEIEHLFNALTANDEGDPSASLSASLIPEIRPKKITYRGLGMCEEQSQPQPQPPPHAPHTPPTNFSPILRNPVDHINATVGELLLYTVPDDTFYDPEDVDVRNLRMSLLTADRQPLPSESWLQFDNKNKEFYGIPLPSHVGRHEYQLLCEDTGGLTASDSLIVEIHIAPKVSYNVEFKMTVVTDYEAFKNSASMQRKFVQKLRKLFDDKHKDNNVHFNSIIIGTGSTVISWYNKTLTGEVCHRSEIRKLESILVNEERTVSNYVQDVMGPEFPVAAVKLQYHGACKTVPIYTRPAVDVPVSVDDTTTQESHEEYLVTFIVPAVIISSMLLLAGIAACVMYRRKRSGKMNVEEDGRSSYGNKGIPVIFQEELEEKPETGNKTPVILKDEKPPLAPPEYSKSGSLKLNDDSEPYQPPPPFTRPQDNGRQPRPKPTPTYRKPPPYVPP